MDDRTIKGKVYTVKGEAGVYRYGNGGSHYDTCVAKDGPYLSSIGGRIGCSCPSWTFDRTKPCKHMRDAVVLYIREKSGINLERWGMYEGDS